MIPSRFTLVNKEYVVRIVTSRQLKYELRRSNEKQAAEEADSIMGLTIQGTSRIYINRDLHRSVEEMEHTFWHEFLHALHFADGVAAHKHDEKKVDRWGGYLHQALGSIYGDSTDRTS